MAVTGDYAPVREAGNGSKTDFDFDFKIIQATDLKVGKILNSTNVKTDMTYGVDYTVTINPTTDGGTVHYSVAPTVLQDSWIGRNVPNTQSNIIPTNNIFREVQVNNALDKQCMVAQQLEEKIGRCLQLSEVSVITDLTIPEPVAGRALKWKTDLTGLENSDYDPDELVNLASDYKDAAALSAAAALVSENNASDAEDAAVTAQGLAEAARDTATTQANTATSEANLATLAKTAAESARDLAQGYAAALNATSTSSVAIGTGAKTFATQTGKQFAAGQFVLAVDQANSANYMFGQVTSYAAGSLVIDSQVIGGSGTKASWYLYAAVGARGAQGAQGIQGVQGDPGSQGPAGDGKFNTATTTVKTDNYIVQATDFGNVLVMNNAGAKAFTLPNITTASVIILKNIGAGVCTITPDGSDTCDVTSLAQYENCILVADTTNNVWRNITRSAAGGATATRGTFTAANLTYTFTIATPSTSPTAGATYTNNGITYTVVSYNANVLVCTGTGYPSLSGALTKASGTGDATLTFSAFTATYVVTHNLAIATAPYTVIVMIANNSNKKIGDPDDITFAANSFTLDMTSFTAMTGTYGYAYIAG